jgi:hypothetical protein
VYNYYIQVGAKNLSQIQKTDLYISTSTLLVSLSGRECMGVWVDVSREWKCRVQIRQEDVILKRRTCSGALILEAQCYY